MVLELPPTPPTKDFTLISCGIVPDVCDNLVWKARGCHAWLQSNKNYVSGYVENYVDLMAPYAIEHRDLVHGRLFDPELTPFPDILKYLMEVDPVFSLEHLKAGYFTFDPKLAAATFKWPYLRSFLTLLRSPREHNQPKDTWGRSLEYPTGWVLDAWKITMDVFDQSNVGLLLAHRVGSSLRWSGMLLSYIHHGHDVTGYVSPKRVRHAMTKPPNPNALYTRDVFFGPTPATFDDGRIPGWWDNKSAGPSALKADDRDTRLRTALTKLKELATNG